MHRSMINEFIYSSIFLLVFSLLVIHQLIQCSPTSPYERSFSFFTAHEMNCHPRTTQKSPNTFPISLPSPVQFLSLSNRHVPKVSHPWTWPCLNIYVCPVSLIASWWRLRNDGGIISVKDAASSVLKNILSLFLKSDNWQNSNHVEST